MKTKFFLTLLSLLLLTACPEKYGNTTGSTQPTLKVAVCQPDNPEAVTDLITILKGPLKQQVWAKQRVLEIQIILPDGETVSVPAPTADGFMVKLFGPNTPSARQQKLDAHLAALETKLKAGCSGKAMSLTTLLAVHETLFPKEDCIVWVTGGDAKNPWAGQKNMPMALVTNSATLDSALDENHAQNLLVLTTPVTMPVVKAVKKPAAKIALKAKAKPATPTTKPATTTGEKMADLPPQQGGDTLVINFGDKEPKPVSTSARTQVVPEGAEPLERPIDFDSGLYSPLNKTEFDRIAAAHRILALSFDVRVIMIAKADAAKGSTLDRNQKLSELRANVCKAAMLARGIHVDETICIGDALAETSSGEERQVSFYVVKKAKKNQTRSANTASR